MKKLRIVTWVVIFALILLLIVGVILQITNKSSVNDTAYEIIGFSVGIVGMIMAVLAEVGGAKQEKDFDKMEDNIRKILKNNQADLEISNKILGEIKLKKKTKIIIGVYNGIKTK